ncbi:hypothetical protein DXC24_14620 [Clostridium sp. OM08-29]|nr:hypothetical protein DXC24_14620 [Clostridium sp. OM08-29]
MTEGQKSRALSWYPMIKNGALSYGKIAKMLGISKHDLIDFYDEQGFAYFSITAEEVDKDVANNESMISNR